MLDVMIDDCFEKDWAALVILDADGDETLLVFTPPTTADQ